MVDSIPDPMIRRSVVLDAATLGIALGVLSMAGGSLVLFNSNGLLIATAGLVATLFVSLLVGLWVSVPSTTLADPPVRDRWLAAALALAAAGAYASFLQLNDRLASGIAGRGGALLLLITIPAYTAGMALPVLLSWARSKEGQGNGDDGSEALGWLVVGLLGGVVIGVISTGALLFRGVSPGPILIGSSILLLTPLLVHSASRPATEEELLFEMDTPFNLLRVTEVVYPGDRQPERRLYLNGEEESGELVRSGAPTLAYIAAAENWLADQTPRGADYLFLGGGAYTLPRRVAERDPQASVTVIELDPEVTNAAYQYFGLRPQHRVQALHGDARAVVSRLAGEGGYDRLYVDVYGGQECLPINLVTIEALESMRGCLREGGMVLMNLIGTTHGPESTRFWSIVSTFATAFPTVGLYLHLDRDFPERQNALLVGSLDAATRFRERTGLFEFWPRAEWPALAAAAIYHDVQPSDSLPPAAGRASMPAAEQRERPELRTGLSGH